MQPRLQLIAPTQVRLLTTVSLDREEFKKDSVVSVEAHDAEYLISRKFAEKLAAGEKAESVNRFEVVQAKTTKVEPKPAEASRQASEETGNDAKSAVAANADAATKR